MHEFGVPEINIPARPFLLPGIEKVEDQAAERMGKAFRAACDMMANGGQVLLEEAGAIAASSAKREVGENGPPLKPATIRNRCRGRGTKSMRASENHYLGLIAGGMDEVSAQAAAGIRALVDMGRLRNSITHVIRRCSRLVTIPLQQLERATTPPIAKGKVRK